MSHSLHGLEKNNSLSLITPVNAGYTRLSNCLDLFSVTVSPVHPPGFFTSDYKILVACVAFQR